MVFVFLFLVLVIIDPILVNAQTGSIFLTYKDPQDRFSISYPQGWDVKPLTNRFQPYVVQFEDLADRGSVSVIISEAANLDARDYIVNLIPYLNNTIRNFRVVEGVECSKYMMAGHNACSFIFSGNITVELGNMGVVTQANGTLYQISYIAEPDPFEKNLPIVEKMIRSFKIGTT
jgi:hypothetical protein